MMTVRPATISDIDAIRTVQRQTWLDTYPDASIGITRSDIAARFARDDNTGKSAWLRERNHEFSDTHKQAWVATQRDVVVGYATAQKERTQNRLNALYVLPNCQRKGIGSALFDTVISWLGKDKPLCIHVAAYNQKAIAFYGMHGCVRTGISIADETARLPKEKTIPEIEMVKTVYS